MSLQSNIQIPDPAAKETYSAIRTGWGMAGGSGFTLLFRDGGGGQYFIFGLHSAHVIKQRLLRANLTSWVPRQHDLYLDAQHTLLSSTWRTAVST